MYDNGMSLSDSLETIESLIRQGRGRYAREKLKLLCEKKISRKHLLRVSSQARRVGLPLLALRLLRPIIRPDRGIREQPTDSELAEFAANLSRIGALDEALSVLEGLDEERNPEVLIYKVFALVPQWQYGRTIPLLEKYLKSHKVPPYEKLIAKANLAAAFVVEKRHGEADSLIDQITKEAQKGAYHLIYGMVLEIAAQNRLDQGKWKETEFFLNQAEQALTLSDPKGQFLVKKWRAILSLHRDREKDSARIELERIRQEAVSLHLWESLRQCDLYEALLTRNPHLFIHLYYGTPHEEYRKKILREFSAAPIIPDHYDFCFSHSIKSPARVDLETGELGSSKKWGVLKVGQIPFRLLQILCSDFYRPFRLGTIFHQLYRNEYFNPESARLRVHAALHRLRRELLQFEIPLEILELSGNYRLSAFRACTITIPLHKKTTNWQDHQLAKLEEKYQHHSFSIREAASHLGISNRSAHRIVATARKCGQLTCDRHGSTVRYFFNSTLAKAA